MVRSLSGIREYLGLPEALPTARNFLYDFCDVFYKGKRDSCGIHTTSPKRRLWASVADWCFKENLVKRAKRGNCYVTSESIYHLLGGKDAGWTPCVLRLDSGRTHWFLRYRSGMVLDVTAKQFGKKTIDYSLGRGSGFLTKKPSRRAALLMEQLVWQEAK